ncbi:DUF2321 domain-containing protein [bacterium SCSIO 12827]|nr:DUF2321 domain-containing protein [bacterium SCSIO 12827]
MGTYRTAQVCMNGHSATSSLETSPELAEKFCSDCGAETISTCPSCQAKIRGDYHVPGVFGMGGYTPPNFCHECGTAFPWARAKIDAAKELADELDELSDDEKEKLKSTIDDLVVAGPKTEVAALRYKKLVGKVGMATASALRSILVDVASEAAKKLLFGD